MGHNAILYIDDGISGHADKISALAASHIVQRDLALAGLKVSVSKSDFEPKQIGEWLGVVIDTISMQISLSDRKIEKIISSVKKCLAIRTQVVPVREIARVAGFLVSAFAAIGPLTRLFTRHL